MPMVVERGGRIARHDFDQIEREADAQPRGEVEAVGDRMVDALTLISPSDSGERDQPLRRLPRHAELRGDLVLRVAGDIIEPAGARRVVEPVRCLLSWRDVHR